MLKIEGLSINYGVVPAVKNISIEILQGEVVTLIGANGSGKSTTLRGISGIINPRKGKILFQGTDLTKMNAHKIVKMGISQVPEGRGIFTDLTVLENLQMGAFIRKDKDGIKKDIEEIFQLLPHLKERKNQPAGTLSGGEQQMLAIGRAIMTKPKLLLLDEPSMGLAPIMVKGIFGIIKKINEEGTTVLLVEQNANMALSIAHRGYVLETGKIVAQGTVEQLQKNDVIRKIYLGMD
ncbi:ABC transporter ATP-binding protein [Neobacillus sp. NPDC093182]|uniref:ABC transporter ATP-binding protein n=1 Tax=Neobacillus sp. NPDC093182 TaxID=3364297 RepID=UPI0038298776